MNTEGYKEGSTEIVFLFKDIFCVFLAQSQFCAGICVYVLCASARDIDTECVWVLCAAYVSE